MTLHIGITIKFLGKSRAVASVENAPNSGAFLGAHEKQAWEMEIYIPVNFVIRELFGSIEKNT